MKCKCWILFCIMICHGGKTNIYAQKIDSIRLTQITQELQTTKKERQKIGLYQLLGNHYYEIDDYSLAHAYYDSSLTGLQISSNLYFEIMKNQSYTLLRLGKYRESLRTLDLIIPYLIQENDSVTLCKCLDRKGYNFIKISKSDSSVHYFLKSLECFENIGDHRSAISELNNLSNVLFRMEEDEQALHYLRMAHNRSIELKDSVMISKTASNLAIQYSYGSALDTAHSYAKLNLKLSKLRSSSSDISKAYLRMALIHLKREKYPKVISYADSAINRNSADESVHITSMKYKAEAYLAEGQLNRALSNINQSIQLAQKGEDLEVIFILHQIAAEVYEQMGLHALALNEYKKYSTLKDSALNMKKLSKIESLITQYDTEQKEQQIVNLTQKNEIQELKNVRHKTLWIFALVTVLLLTVIIIFFYQKRLMVQKEKTAIHRQQLLRSQMNPHFIFNALTSIRGFLFENPDLKGAVNYLGQFAKLMRMVLDHSSQEWVTLQEELDALKIYLDIQQMRFNHTFQYTIQIDPELSPEKIRVPPLLAQPFVENAIEHGFKKIPYEGQLSFICQSEGDLIRFAVIDNGVGIDHVRSKESHESKALSIFKQRVEILGRQLKSNLTLIIKDLGTSSDETGTKVEYTIPHLSHA